MEGSLDYIQVGCEAKDFHADRNRQIYFQWIDLNS
jgi:hypothetical protein